MVPPKPSYSQIVEGQGKDSMIGIEACKTNIVKLVVVTTMIPIAPTKAHGGRKACCHTRRAPCHSRHGLSGRYFITTTRELFRNTSICSRFSSILALMRLGATYKRRRNTHTSCDKGNIVHLTLCPSSHHGFINPHSWQPRHVLSTTSIWGPRLLTYVIWKTCPTWLNSPAIEHSARFTLFFHRRGTIAEDSYARSVPFPLFLSLKEKKSGHDNKHLTKGDGCYINYPI